MKPCSATNRWEVWFGIGPYQNQPVWGVIPTKEKDYNGWRKMYTGSERRQFSRWKTAINLMIEEIAVYGETASAALKERDDVFTALSPFISLLKEQKKSRETNKSSKASNDKSPSTAEIVDI